MIYDDKSTDIPSSGQYLVLPSVDVKEDVIFRASFMVLGELHCEGKVSALFDLIVLGNIEAQELDVKGRFVCLGNCVVQTSMSVQTDIWAEDIVATSIICHDRIVAQSIDATSVLAEGTITIGKTLAIEELAETSQSIICGETAFGSGKLIASTIMTTEPLDLDDGIDAIGSPNTYIPEQKSFGKTILEEESSKYASSNDYIGFLDKLSSIPDEAEQLRISRFRSVLSSVDFSNPSSILETKDVSLLIWLIEICNSEYFRGWSSISQWTDAVQQHFETMANGIQSIEQPAKPADRFQKGYIVSHKKYGKGIVKSIIPSSSGRAGQEIAEVLFDTFGEKKFTIPESLKYFEILGEEKVLSKREIRNIIECRIDSYEEWLIALSLIEKYKSFLGNTLHEIIFELLIEKIGLKAQFIENRFKEKGWQ